MASFLPVLPRPVNDLGRAINLALYSPDGRILVGGGGVISHAGDIVVWEAATLQPVERLSTQKATVHKLAFAPDSRTLAVSTHGGYGDVELWDTQTWQCLTTLHPPKETLVGDMAFSPDGKTLAVGYWDMTAKLWNLASGELRELPSERNRNVDTVAFLEDGTVLLTGTTNRLKTWDMATGTQRNVVELPSDQLIWKHQATPDGNTVVSVGHLGTIRLWETKNWEYREYQTGRKKRLSTMTCYPNSSVLVTGTDNGRITFWRLSDMKKLGVWKICEDAAMSLSFAPDGATLAGVFSVGFDCLLACDVPHALL